MWHFKIVWILSVAFVASQGLEQRNYVSFTPSSQVTHMIGIAQDFVTINLLFNNISSIFYKVDIIKF